MISPEGAVKPVSVKKREKIGLLIHRNCDFQVTATDSRSLAATRCNALIVNQFIARQRTIGSGTPGKSLLASTCGPFYAQSYPQPARLCSVARRAIWRDCSFRRLTPALFLRRSAA
ncbi:MAG: hypothetical protein SF172_07830 [Burkholderiales bacterium]|nr:hypothetical protein [Burkholderiales bacterium]